MATRLPLRGLSSGPEPLRGLTSDVSACLNTGLEGFAALNLPCTDRQARGRSARPVYFHHRSVERSPPFASLRFMGCSGSGPYGSAMHDQPPEDLGSIAASLLFAGVLVVLVIIGGVLAITG